MDRGLGRGDEVGEGLALAACRECRIDQRRGSGAAADVGVADGRRLAVRAGERDLPGTERTISLRELRLRLVAGEPAEVVLPTRTPGRIRPSYCWPQAYRTPTPMPMVRRKPRTNETPKRRASDRRRRGRAGGSPSGVAAARLDRRRGAEVASPVAMSVGSSGGSGGTGADECRELGVARGGVRRRMWSWAGRSSDTHARSACTGPRPPQEGHLRACARICHVTGHPPLRPPLLAVSSAGTRTRKDESPISGHSGGRVRAGRTDGDLPADPEDDCAPAARAVLVDPDGRRPVRVRARASGRHRPDVRRPDAVHRRDPRLGRRLPSLIGCDRREPGAQGRERPRPARVVRRGRDPRRTAARRGRHRAARRRSTRTGAMATRSRERSSASSPAIRRRPRTSARCRAR